MAKVNLNFLPMKAHYFLFNGALSGVIPFLPVFASQLGLSTTAIGLIYSILPFLAVVAKPLFGFVADKFHILKKLLMVFIITTTLSTLCMSFIQYYPDLFPSSSWSNVMLCTSVGPDLRFYSGTNATCTTGISSKPPPQCNLHCIECDLNIMKDNFSDKIAIERQSCHFNLNSSVNVKVNLQMHQNVSLPPWQLEFNVKKIFTHDHVSMNLNCSSDTYFACNGSCYPDMNHCITQESQPEYFNAQFWVFLFLIIVLWVSSGISVSLADAACFNILADRPHLYGRQRLWGTIGWGLFIVLTGFLNDLATPEGSNTNHSPGFYLLIILMFIDLAAIFYLKTENVKISQNPLKDVKSLLAVPKVLEFISAVFMVGAFTGLFWNYLFIYLQSLRANSLLMGLSSAVQCFLGELPFFFFSGWLIHKLGHAQTLTMTFFAFGLRFILYSYLKNPWWVLPIELLQGPTFGAFYSAMTSYASVAAPPGTEATMQGLVGAAFEGLGVAAGSLLGGISFDFYNGSVTFFWAGIIAFVSSFLHFAFCMFVNSKEKNATVNSKKQDLRSSGEAASFL